MSVKEAKLKIPAAEKTLTIGEAPIASDLTEIARWSADSLAEQYEALRLEEKRIGDLRDVLADEVKRRMGAESATELETMFGTFKIESARSYSWSVDSVKDVMGRAWTSFVKADDKTLRARMQTKDETGCALEAVATLTVVPKLKLAVK